MLIGLYRGKSILSRVIRWQTWSEYSHASAILREAPRDGRNGMIVHGEMSAWLNETTVVEAWQESPVRFWRGQVYARNGIHEGHSNGTRIDVFEVVDDDFKPRMAAEFLRLQVGKKYDWRGLIGFLSRRDGAARTDAWFCSELVFGACAVANCRLLANTAAHQVSPGLLARSPKLRRLGMATTGERRSWVPDLSKAAMEDVRYAG